MNKKVKVYVVGGGQDGHFIDNSIPTKNFDDADIVLFRGGEDINPALYGQKNNSYCGHWNSKRDNFEIEMFRNAERAGKMIIGTCRGGQLATALLGGKLIQHIRHFGDHNCKTIEGEIYMMNSLHHQMMYPYNLNPDEYTVYSWTEQISPVHYGENDEQIEFPVHSLDENGLFKEPEIIIYPKARCIAIQGHF